MWGGGQGRLCLGGHAHLSRLQKKNIRWGLATQCLAPHLRAHLPQQGGMRPRSEEPEGVGCWWGGVDGDGPEGCESRSSDD